MKKYSMLLLLSFLVLGSNLVMGDEQIAYAVQYSRGSSDASTTQASISTQTDKSGNTAEYVKLTSTSYAYQRTNGMHLSSSKKDGSALLSLTEIGMVKATKVVTNALAKDGKSFSISVTYSDNTTETQTFVPGTTSVDNTLTLDANKVIVSISYSAAKGVVRE